MKFGYLPRHLALSYAIIAIVNFSYTAHAQKKIIFQNINVESGLSKSSAVCISQDKSGIIWIGTTSGLNKYDGTNFSIFKNNSSDTRSIAGSDVAALLSDSKDNLWVGTSNGLDLYIPTKECFQHILRGKQISCLKQDKTGKVWVGTFDGLYTVEKQKTGSWLVKHQNILNTYNLAVWSIYQDASGSLWFGTPKGLINITHRQGKKQTRLYQHIAGDPHSISANDVTSIIDDKYGRLWVGTRKNGINLFDRKSQKFIRFLHSVNNENSLVNDNVRKMIIDDKGSLWVGTQDGLSVLDIKTNKFTTYQHDPSDGQSLSQNSIYELFQDFQGNILIGTYFGGVNKVDKYSTPFRIYQNDVSKQSINSNVISAIIEDKSQNLWIGTEAKGLNYFDRKNNTYKEFKNEVNNSNSLSSNLIKTIIIDDNNVLWIGMSRGGMDKFDPSTNVFTHFRSDRNQNPSLMSDYVECLFIDSKGRFWVGTDLGLNRYYTDLKKFESHFNISGKQGMLTGMIIAIDEDHLHNLWVSTSKGLYFLKNGSESFTPILHQQDDLKQINCIKEDNSGVMWLGTETNGLFSYDPLSQRIKKYDKTDGLQSHNIQSIEEDQLGNIWMGTDRGLTKLSSDRLIFLNYGLQDGLPGVEFNLGSSFIDSKGEIFFGGFKGIVSFNPSEIKRNPLAPKIVFTGLKLFNNAVSIDGKDKLLNKSIGKTDHLTFFHSQNVFTLNFAALNYIKPLKNRYAYKLDGFEKEWNFVDVPSASYTNLSAGSYVLLVKGTNNDGVWSSLPAKMIITVLPPFWETWWAYVIYCVLFGVAIYQIIRFVKAREKLKGELLFEQRELSRQQALHQMKINFFTKVSHEIRTPLTLVSGPVESLLSIVKGNLTLEKPLKTIKSNSDRLIKLTSELLEFGKIELGKLKINVREQNIVSFLEEVILSFKHLADRKEIKLNLQCDKDIVNLYYDREQMEKVFYNLLSNALKFTPNNGEIKIIITTRIDSVEIQVLDTGIGIPTESLEMIFLDFYQAHQDTERFSGSGLGLALSKGIVEMHFGKIFATNLAGISPDDFNTCITVQLKQGNGHFNNYEQKPLVAQDLIQHPALIEDIGQLELSREYENALILIVEDNEELRNFIWNSLKDRYKVEVSPNGLIGLNKAREIIPDLIISDVMMPEMNGIELCHKLKNDYMTSHIPVVLLTALSEYSYHLQGLNVGADAYIAKPFSIKLLHLQINNIFALRSAVQKKHAQNLMLGKRMFESESEDDRFLEKLLKIIEQNIDNEELSLVNLTSEMAMSKSVLYKKFSALTSLSLTDFIKTHRLKHAACLLRENNYSVGQVAIMVGFSDQKYFSKQFKKLFGITPSEYIRDTVNQKLN